MTDISRVIIDKYEIRKNKKQKEAFREYLVSELTAMGYSVKVEGKRAKNVVVGDVDNAKIVFGAHYDTCAVMPIPNFITPCNLFMFILYQLAVTVLILGVVAVISVGVYFLAGQVFIAWYFAWMLSLIGIMALMMAGPANKHTMNDNTSGVLALVELMSSLPLSERERAAFVFFDMEELGLVGSSEFAKLHANAMKEKPLINYDCVGDGETMLFVANRKYKKNERLIKLAKQASENTDFEVEIPRFAIYPSDQANFPVALAVSSMRSSKLVGLYMSRIHTKRDTICEERNIEYIVGLSTRLINGI